MDNKGSVRARDLIIVVLVVGLVSLGVFNIVGGWREVYNVTSNETFDEDSLQANEDVTDTIDGLKDELENADNVVSQTFILLFGGFKVAVLSLISVFQSIQAFVGGLLTYLGLGEYISYIILIILVTVIFTVWRALQGRDQV
jgi:hypothetical protein